MRRSEHAELLASKAMETHATNNEWDYEQAGKKNTSHEGHYG